jgi:hypothetical protein
LQVASYIAVMSDLNPYFGVTLAVFAGYAVLALLGSRERGAQAPYRLWGLRRRLRDWLNATRIRKWLS